MTLRNAKVFTALDCTEGFFQIMVHPKDRPKTAFVTPHGLFQYKRCPFGFTKSPAVFQRAMNSIFSDGLYTRCVIYIDDIIIFGNDHAQLEENTRWVLKRCRQASVQLKLTKCQFVRESVEFLGHRISHNSIGPIPSKTDPLVGLKPARKTDILSLLGTLNYYSRFISNYSEKTKEFRKLASSPSIVWTITHETNLKALVAELYSAAFQTLPEIGTAKTVNIHIEETSMEVDCRETSG